MRRISCLLACAAILPAAGCSAPAKQGAPTAPGHTTVARALYYSAGGSVYVSDPVGSPGRKLTDGPGDTQPAPSPDGSRIAFVRKADGVDYGGELWVLEAASGESERLVDPAVLVPKVDGERPQVASPRWSPTGDRIAFVKTGPGGGGFLLTADAKTGAVQAPSAPTYADENFAWSPDGTRIAWVGGRTDVSPVDVNVLTVGGGSSVAAKATNATSVSYDRAGTSILFSNLDSTGSLFTGIPFGLRGGGIFTVDAAKPGPPKPLLSGPTSYSDVWALASGEVGFSEWSPDQTTKSVMVLGRDRVSRKIGETRSDAQRPVWADDDSVAYIGNSDNRSLQMTTTDGTTTTVAAGVDAFAWGGKAAG